MDDVGRRDPPAPGGSAIRQRSAGAANVFHPAARPSPSQPSPSPHLSPGHGVDRRWSAAGVRTPAEQQLDAARCQLDAAPVLLCRLPFGCARGTYACMCRVTGVAPAVVLGLLVEWPARVVHGAGRWRYR